MPLTRNLADIRGLHDWDSKLVLPTSRAKKSQGMRSQCERGCRLSIVLDNLTGACELDTMSGGSCRTNVHTDRQLVLMMGFKVDIQVFALIVSFVRTKKSPPTYED